MVLSPAYWSGDEGPATVDTFASKPASLGRWPQISSNVSDGGKDVNVQGVAPSSTR